MQANWESSSGAQAAASIAGNTAKDIYRRQIQNIKQIMRKCQLLNLKQRAHSSQCAYEWVSGFTGIWLTYFQSEFLDLSLQFSFVKSQ